MMVFMLAANRYYAVCRYQFYGLYFTPAKIRCYSIAILIFVVITGVSKLFEYCVIDVVGVNLQKTIQYGSLAVFIIIGCPVNISTVVCYSMIYRKLRRGVTFNNTSENSLETVSDNNANILETSQSWALDESEVSFLRSIAIFSVLAVPCVLLDYSLTLIEVAYFGGIYSTVLHEVLIYVLLFRFSYEYVLPKWTNYRVKLDHFDYWVYV